MPDPISGVTTNPLGLGGTSQAGQTGQTGAAQAVDSGATSGTVVASTDQADVGGTEALLAQIIQVANNAPSVDETKVNALQQAIQNGTYQVDLLAIAKKLMGLDTNSGQDE